MVIAPVLNSPVSAPLSPCFDPFATRSLLDLVQVGEKFEWIKSDCTEEEWQEMRRRHNEDYADGSRSIAKSYQKLEAHPQLRSRLHQLRFEFFPVQAGAKLLKLDIDILEKCVSDLEGTQLTVKFLSEGILKEAITKYRPTTSQKINLEDAIANEQLENISRKLGLDAENLELIQQQLSDDDVSASELINFCHEKHLATFSQIRKLLTSKEYIGWIEGKTELYQHKSLELLSECDRLQNVSVSLSEDNNSLTEENYRLTQALELLQQRLIALEANTSQPTEESPSPETSSPETTEQQESSLYDVDSSAPMQTEKEVNANAIAENQCPYPTVNEYSSQASVGILKDGQIVDKGKMIGQLKGQIRVKCDSGENELFDLVELVLLPEENSPSKDKKSKVKVPRKKKGFGQKQLIF